MKPAAKGFLAVTAGFLVLYAVLSGTANYTKSNYGEFGGLILLATLTAAVLIERSLSRRTIRQCLISLGYVKPSTRSGWAAGVLTTTLLAVVLGILVLKFAPTVPLRPAWPLLLLGLFFQGGLAEETIFRGFLFRRFREKTDFWPAALISLVPFTLAHVYLFGTMPAPVAALATLVAVSTSLPFAKLFDLSGNSIYPCALLHFATHLIKIVEWPKDTSTTAQLVWMGAAAIVPWAVFLFRQGDCPNQGNPVSQT